MSWIEKVQTDLIITTGDGKEYKPLWMPASKVLEFNIAEFDFPEVSGTLVKKSKPKARKFDLEIYFQGDDYLETSEAFDISSRDERPWVILHPFYGSITVQVAGLSFDNTKYNSVKITGTLIETITDDNPKTVIDPISTIKLDKETLDESFVDSFDETPTQTNITAVTATNNKFYTLGKKITSIAEESENYFNLFNTANAAVLNATALPLAAISAVQAMINAPALFTENVKSRVTLLSDQFTSLRDGLENITDRAGKKIYESIGGSLISAHALAASTPLDTDFKNMNKVLEIIELIIDNYNAYLLDLDSLQTENGGDPDSYIPDAKSLTDLNKLINFTVSSLFKIALNSKQERTIILEDDSNWILLTHRFYGLDALDNNINELMENNDAGINEILSVRKGRKITYYI